MPCSTPRQWDALAHCGSRIDADGDGVREVVFYDGFRGGSDIAGPDAAGGTGARALGIEQLARAGVQGRGVHRPAPRVRAAAGKCRLR